MERDPLLRRLERRAVIACGAMAVVALALRRGNPDAAVGVLAGGVLSAISYGTIKGAIDAVIDGAVAERPPRRRWWALVRGLARYGLLGLAAYVMIVRLRLNPVGLVAGVSSLVIAAGWEGIGGTPPAARAGQPKGVEPSDSRTDTPEFHGEA
jgi:hypothetical protein